MPTNNAVPFVYHVGWVDKLLRTLIMSGMLVYGLTTIADIFYNFYSDWYWLILALVYTITINETFTHRICAHKLFEVDTDSWTYKILTFLSSADLGHGPVRVQALGHLAHHIYADQGRADPANAKEFWFGAACDMPLRGWFRHTEIPNAKDLFRRSHRLFHSVIDDPWTQFCERYTTVISVVYLTVLYFVFPEFLFKVVLVGRVFIALGMMLAGVCHLKNIPLTYRHVDTLDDSNNNLIAHYLLLGLFSGLLQNNHHSHPNALNLSRAWYEIDTSTPIVYLLKFLMEEKHESI